MTFQYGSLSFNCPLRESSFQRLRDTTDGCVVVVIWQIRYLAQLSCDPLNHPVRHPICVPQCLHAYQRVGKSVRPSDLSIVHLEQFLVPTLDPFEVQEVLTPFDELLVVL